MRHFLFSANPLRTPKNKFFSANPAQNKSSNTFNKTFQLVNGNHHALGNAYYAIMLLGTILSPIALVSLMTLTDELDQRIEHWRSVFQPPKKLGSLSNVSEDLLTSLIPKTLRDISCDTIKVIRAKKTRVVYFYGPGGTGKHDLAVNVAYQVYKHSTDYPELYTHAEYPTLYSIDASNSAALTESFKQFAIALGLRDIDTSCDKRVFDNIILELIKRPGAVLIFKCVKSPEFIDEYISKLSKCRITILVTTGKKSIAKQAKKSGYEFINLQHTLTRADLADAFQKNPMRWLESKQPTGSRLMTKINGDPAIFRQAVAYLHNSSSSMLAFEEKICEDKPDFTVIQLALESADSVCNNASDLLKLIAIRNEPQRGIPLDTLQDEFTFENFDAAYHALHLYGLIRLTDNGYVYPIFPVAIQRSDFIETYLQQKKSNNALDVTPLIPPPPSP